LLRNHEHHHARIQYGLQNEFKDKIDEDIFNKYYNKCIQDTYEAKVELFGDSHYCSSITTISSGGRGEKFSEIGLCLII